MKISIALSSALFALTVLAAPPLELDVREVVHRNIADNLYADHFAGALITSPPPQERFKSISATFNVPNISYPIGVSSGTYLVLAYVAIDGIDNNDKTLLLGISSILQDNKFTYEVSCAWGSTSFDDFSGFSVVEGDSISASIDSSGPTSATVTLTNLSSGIQFSRTVDSPNPESNLLGQEVGWMIIQERTGADKPLVNFSPVVFTDCRASTGKKEIGVSGATLKNINRNGTTYASTSINSDSKITIRDLG